MKTADFIFCKGITASSDGTEVGGFEVPDLTSVSRYAKMVIASTRRGEEVKG
jgi:hypothetical protein